MKKVMVIILGVMNENFFVVRELDVTCILFFICFIVLQFLYRDWMRKKFLK